MTGKPLRKLSGICAMLTASRSKDVRIACSALANVLSAAATMPLTPSLARLSRALQRKRIIRKLFRKTPHDLTLEWFHRNEKRGHCSLMLDNVMPK